MLSKLELITYNLLTEVTLIAPPSLITAELAETTLLTNVQVSNVILWLVAMLAFEIYIAPPIVGAVDPLN